MFNKKTDHPRGSKKLIGAWTWYDWANSVYSLVISSAIFPIYYSQYIFAQTNSVIIFNLEINKDTSNKFSVWFFIFNYCFFISIIKWNC